jgi:GGDEF domain-containing protein
VVQPDTDVAEAATASARVFKEVEAASSEIGIPVTVSVGATYVDPASDTPDTAIHRADLALYASKGMGRNRFSVDGGA